MNILVLAYAVSPYRGSEYSVAWNYIKKMSHEHKLTVIYGTSGEHIGDIEEFEQYIKHNPIRNVKFIPVRPTRSGELLNYFNRHNILKYSFYFAYNDWHKEVYKIAKHIVEQNKIDLIHYLTPIGYREPGYLWKLDLPYMWGPIGGFSNYPKKMMDSLPLSYKLKYSCRSIINNFQIRYSKRVYKAIKRADLVLACTTENQNIINIRYDINVKYLPENGLLEDAIIDEEKFENIENRTINIIFVGSLDGRKNTITLLQAIKYLNCRNSFHVDIVGDGPLFTQLVNFVKYNNLESIVTLHGKMKREDIFNLYNKAHINVITSLGEGNPTVILEAMKYGVPTLTIDHCGMHDTVTESTGFKIPVDSCENIAKNIANVLEEININRDILKTKAFATLERSKNYLWDVRVRAFNQYYKDCINNYKSKKN